MGYSNLTSCCSRAALFFSLVSLFVMEKTATNAFTVGGRRSFGTRSPRLFAAPPETTVQVTDVEEAVEALQEAEIFEPAVEEVVTEDEEVIIAIENDLPEPPADLDKETLTEDIERVLLENETALSPPEIASEGASVNQPELEEAAISASLYMNPATAKIASNLVITWEPTAAELLSHMVLLSNPNRPLMIGLVGIPGSGKSTSAEILAALLNTTDSEKEAIVMPMDGFHLSLETLGQMPNAPDMIYRRGAPDTFDPHGLAVALERIRSGNETTVTIPGFDHAKGDPVPNQHTFDRSRHNVVICEGIYLLHDNDGWENIKSFFDWTIYIDADVDACIERLKERNKCIPGYTPEEIETRCDVVDRSNAELSRDGARKFASQIVGSGAS